MDRDDTRIDTVLRELADLGMRIGERAGELARLAADCHRVSASPPASDNGPAEGSRKARASGPRPTHHDHGRHGRHGRHARLSVVPRQSPRTKPSEKPSAKPNKRRARAGRIRMHGPALVSSLVHLAMLIGLALMYIKVEAKPVRVALTLGETTALEEPTLESVSLVPLDSIQQSDIQTETDPLTLESQQIVETVLSEELPAALPVPDTALAENAGASAAASFDPGDMAAMLAEVVGGGQRGDGRGEGPGGGDVAGGQAAGQAAATFFGRAGQGRSVCFICDNSNSHRDGSFHVVLDELVRAVDSLRPEQSFFVIFTSDAAYPLFHPVAADALQPATVENKRKLRAWLETVEMCRGGQGIHEAMSMAGSLGADVIYLLSDGEFAASVVERLEVADIGRSVVHTFGVQQHALDRRTGQVDPDGLREQQARNLNLVTIATAHGGTFTPVSVPAPVAALERLRPIPRNRSRGAIWGVRL